MMTALIKMGQIEKDCVTIEIQKGLPAGDCAPLSLSLRRIEKKRREEERSNVFQMSVERMK